MAGRGPAPSPTRRRRNTDTVPTTTITPDKRKRGPALPARKPAWHARTRAWWEVWRCSPQAQIMLATDWSFLLDTALLHHLMWSEENAALAGEVRLRVAKLGATLEDRVRLRLQVEVPEPAPRKRPTGVVTNIVDERRRRLLEADAP